MPRLQSRKQFFYLYAAPFYLSKINYRLPYFGLLFWRDELKYRLGTPHHYKGLTLFNLGNIAVNISP